MARSIGRSAFLSLAITIVSLLLVSPLGSAPTRVFEVATDSAVGNNSLGMPGSQDVIRDPFGKYVAAYVDAHGNLSIAFANNDPASPGAWGPSVKSPPPTVPYRRPATVFTSPLTMRILAEGGPAAGDLVDVPVQINRDLAGNIASLSYGSPSVVATSAQYVSATLAHDGSIIAVWNSAIPGSSSTVFALRWTFASGWRSVSNPFSAAPDVVIVDVSDTEPMHPNVIERPDTFAVYVMGNRGPRSNLTTLVFNSATFNGAGWSWGTQDLAYETNASRGFSDATDLAWDPVRSVVVATYDISQTSRYGVIRIDASGAPRHDEQRMGSSSGRPEDRRLLPVHRRHASRPTLGLGVRRRRIHAMFEWHLVPDLDDDRQRDEQHGDLSPATDDAGARGGRFSGVRLREGENGACHDHLRPCEPLRRIAPRLRHSAGISSIGN